MIHRPADVAAGIAILQASHENSVEAGAGDDSELAGERHRTSESPAGHSYTHAALNEDRGRSRHQWLDDLYPPWLGPALI
jgi:hypothetical protein